MEEKNTTGPEGGMGGVTKRQARFEFKIINKLRDGGEKIRVAGKSVTEIEMEKSHGGGVGKRWEEEEGRKSSGGEKKDERSEKMIGR